MYSPFFTDLFMYFFELYLQVLSFSPITTSWKFD
jgi:hypothetical protein